MPRKTIESIDSSKDKSSVSKLFEKITFIVRNPCGKDIAKKTLKKKNIKKREQNLQNSISENIISCYNLVYPDFVSRERAIPSTQDYVNILQDLFCRNFLISVKSICNEVEAALV